MELQLFLFSSVMIWLNQIPNALFFICIEIYSSSDMILKRYVNLSKASIAKIRARNCIAPGLTKAITSPSLRRYSFELESF